MDKMINSLSEIEEKTKAVMEEAGERKKQIDAKMREDTERFDRQVEAETEEKLAQIRARMDAEAEAELCACRQQTDSLLCQLAANYEKNHAALAQALFWEMTEG